MSKAKTTKTKKAAPAKKPAKAPAKGGKKAKRASLTKRNEKIAKMYATGKYSVRSLASKVGLSKTRVHEIVRRTTIA